MGRVPSAAACSAAFRLACTRSMGRSWRRRWRNMLTWLYPASSSNTEGVDVTVADPVGVVGVRADDHRNAAPLHFRQHGRSRVHLGIGLVAARGVQLHGHTGGGDAVETGEDMVHGPLRAPVRRGEILDQVGMGDGVEQAGLGGPGQMLEIGADVGVHIPLVEAVEVLRKVGMDRTEHVVECGHAVQLLQPGLHAGHVIALHAKADIDLAGPGFAGALDHGHVVVQFVHAHPRLRGPAVVRGVVVGDHDPLQTPMQGHFGILLRFAACVFAERGVHVHFVQHRFK